MLFFVFLFYLFVCFYFFLSSKVPHSSPVYGGNATISWMLATNQIQKKKKKRTAVGKWTQMSAGRPGSHRQIQVLS